MATRDIRPSTAHTICDVCGRTLLRGERAEAYLHGGDRRWVCELCKPRALHEGWVREGTVPSFSQGSAGSERRRSLLGRLRGRRESSGDRGSSLLQRPDGEGSQGGSRSEAPGATDGPPRTQRVREPRHVRAIPTSAEQKTASGIEMFNSSEHIRTIAGVARSLGLPTVSALPSEVRQSQVNIVVSWELCWYRYEVDLAEETSTVRVAAQGYELDELTAQERQPNAVADDSGKLSLAAG